MDTVQTVTTNQLLLKLQQKVQTAQLPADVKEKIQDELSKIEISVKSNHYSPETDKAVAYVAFVCELPWNKTGEDILDLKRAREILDKNHYGVESIKERILEYLAVMILNKKKGVSSKQPILGFVGLVGSGKTSLAYSIAESLGRPIVRIPFGGLGSALQLRGESRVKPEAEPGMIMKALRRTGIKNPVVLLDELDRVTEDARNDIMGVLVEMLDPEQNTAFLDHYVGFPFDISQVMFIATANNTNNIATAVMDRIEIAEMPFYSDEQKAVIGRSYLLPEALSGAGIDPGMIQVAQDVWPAIVRPLGFDGGIRSLKRNIDSIVRKLAKKIVEGVPGPYQISVGNLGEYLQIT